MAIGFGWLLGLGLLSAGALGCGQGHPSGTRGKLLGAEAAAIATHPGAQVHSKILRPGSAAANDMTVDSAGNRYDILAVFGHCDGKVFRSFHQYDLGAIPADAQVLSAKYHNYIMGSCSDADVPTAVFRLLEPFDEATLTWANQPAVDWATPYGPRLVGPGAAPEGYRDWDLTALVQFWVDHPGANYGFVLAVPAGGDGAVSGANAEQPAALAPYLEVVYSTAKGKGRT